MPKTFVNRAAANKEYNSFVRGLITEASPLTYPENASIDEENFILNRNGSRRRRQGIDYESSYALGSAIANSLSIHGIMLLIQDCTISL